MSVAGFSVQIPSCRNLKERSKRSAYTTKRRGREVIPSCGSNAAADLFYAANMQKRKRSGNGEKRKNISRPRPLLMPDNPEEQTPHSIQKRIL